MLNTKAKKCIFIGYKDTAKCYKSMESIIKKTIYSRDVIFKEVKSTPKHDNKPREREKKPEIKVKNVKFNLMNKDELNGSNDD